MALVLVLLLLYLTYVHSSVTPVVLDTDKYNGDITELIKKADVTIAIGLLRKSLGSLSDITKIFRDKGNNKCICGHDRSETTYIGSGTDTKDVCFKFQPKHKDVKDYIGILNYTLSLLEQRDEWDFNRKIQKMKEEIHSILAIPKRDCKELYDSGHRKDGVYKISPDGKTSFSVFCDMKHGGWTYIQRRNYGNVRFDRTWPSYAEGFGDLRSDHWVGLNKIHQLTKEQPSLISFQFLMSDNNANASAVYNGFYIDDEESQFRMHVKRKALYNRAMRPYIDDNGFYHHNNMAFSTMDRDNDVSAKQHCSKNTDNSGYWYRQCYTLAGVNTNFNRMYIWNRKLYRISRSEIKIMRPSKL